MDKQVFGNFEFEASFQLISCIVTAPNMAAWKGSWFPYISRCSVAPKRPQISLPLIQLRPRQNGCHFADNSFKCIFLNENVSISIKISLKFDPKGPNNNILALVPIMAWRHPGDKPLSEPMMVSFLTHICVTRPQWVNPFTRSLLR